MSKDSALSVISLNLRIRSQNKDRGRKDTKRVRNFIVSISSQVMAEIFSRTKMACASNVAGIRAFINRTPQNVHIQTGVTKARAYAPSAIGSGIVATKLIKMSWKNNH